MQLVMNYLTYRTVTSALKYTVEIAVNQLIKIFVYSWYIYSLLIDRM